MKRKEAVQILDRIGFEGFDYTFTDYSDWEDIKDDKFHELRKKYCAAQSELEAYLKGLAPKNYEYP